ncbi:hypothetical protein H2198_010130 [Neophaeococcomyces mojaviensis]|uniref:Uncharacterized protein n=1 Tax=Neophaeococcomyces mojaviensis TaxID=3383035 RepID=A0ACC2ZSM9_9EURO|nr:hypothetical protein H2198_010130 [Knufia sp. JES_112]
MVLLISTTFKRWKGLYFWSLCICNYGVASYSLGMMLMYFDLSVLWLSKVLLDAGWICMVICQSLVLYSRLGLVVENLKILRAVKWMIIIDSIVLVIATTVLDFGTTYSGVPTFTQAYFYVEHIQMTGFALQETIISGIYIWKTIDLLKIVSTTNTTNTRTMVWQLLVINIIIIAMDVALVVLQYKHLQLYQESIKGFVYSVKLKLELNILSKLVDLVNGASTNRTMTLEVIDSTAIPGQAQTEVKRELSRQENLGSFFGNDNKGAMKYTEDSLTVKRRRSSAVSRSPDENDGITQIPSQQFRRRRTSDQESSALYADMVRSLSGK